MDPNPSNFPFLSYVMTRLPSSFGGGSNSTVVSDLESIQIDAQPQLARPEPSSCSDPGGLVNRMPHLSDPKVIAAMTRAVSDVAETRSVLNALGDRPDHETVDAAKARLAAVESSLSKKLEELVLSPRPADVDRLVWRSHLAEREKQCRDAAEKDERDCKAVLQLDELHAAYEKLLRDAEEKLVKIYRSAEDGGLVAVADVAEQLEDQVSEEVVGILQHASGSGAALDRINLTGRRLRFLPEAFGKIAGLLHLDLSKNDLQVIPDSIAGLEKLQELNVASNHLESLPDTIGLLQNLKFLNVSGNKLVALPDSICQCRSLVELDVSFNNITYLPTNIGYELVNLEVLSIQLNKIRSLPTSVCELTSLRSLDAHFNELRGLPLAFGQLNNLQSLNLASNFTDLTELPETFGDLTKLKELDLSNNQFHALPDTFGRLDNLTKLNLDGNPLVLPPPDIVHQGVDAVKLFMGKRWLEILVEEERKSMLQVNEQQETGWLTRSTSWLKDYVSGVSGYLSPRSLRDPILDQQL